MKCVSTFACWPKSLAAGCLFGLLPLLMGATLPTTNLNLWVKADVGVFKDDMSTAAQPGDLVAIWESQQGSHDPFQLGATANRCTYVVDKGMKGVCVDYWRPDSQGLNRVLYIPTPPNLQGGPANYATNPQAFTAMMVVEMNTVDRNSYLLTLGEIHTADTTPDNMALFVKDGVLQVWFNDPEPVERKSSLLVPSSKCVIVWRAGSTDMDLYLNSTTPSSVTKAPNTTTLNGGEISGANGGWFTICELALYNRELNDTEVGDLITYAIDRHSITVPSSTTRRIVVDGDSLSEGLGATRNRPFWRLVSDQENICATCHAITGQTLRTYGTTIGAAADASEMSGLLTGSNDTVLCPLGTNDIRIGALADDVYGHATDGLKVYCQARRTAGAERIVVWTLNHNDNNLEQRDIFNARLRADFTVPTSNPYVFATKIVDNYADYLVDIAAHPLIGTGSPHSRQYWFDFAHLTDAGYAIEAEIVATLFRRNPTGATITVATEASDERVIKVQLTDASGNNTAGRHQVTLALYADANGDAYATNVGSSGHGLRIQSGTTSGTMLSLVDAAADVSPGAAPRKAFVATCEDDGHVDLVWKDTTTMAPHEVYLGVVLPNGKVVISAKIQNSP